MTNDSPEERVDPELISAFLLHRHQSLLAELERTQLIGRIVMVVVSLLGVYTALDISRFVALTGTATFFAMIWMWARRAVPRELSIIEEVMTRSYGKRSLKEWEHRYIELRGVLEWRHGTLGGRTIVSFLEPGLWLCWVWLLLLWRYVEAF